MTVGKRQKNSATKQLKLENNENCLKVTQLENKI